MAERDETEPAFRVTLKDVYLDVQSIKKLIGERLPEDIGPRLRKVENQIAAQWVVVGIIVVGLGAMLARTFTS